MAELVKVSLWDLSTSPPSKKQAGWKKAQEKGNQTLFFIGWNTVAIKELCKDFTSTFLQSTTNAFFIDILEKQTQNCTEWESTQQ